MIHRIPMMINNPFMTFSLSFHKATASRILPVTGIIDHVSSHVNIPLAMNMQTNRQNTSIPILPLNFALK